MAPPTGVSGFVDLTFASHGGREGLVGVGIAGGIVAGIAAIALAAVFGGRRR